MELKTAALWRPSDQGETTTSKPQKSQNLQSLDIHKQAYCRAPQTFLVPVRSQACFLMVYGTP
jgi:hypothetical protein